MRDFSQCFGGVLLCCLKLTVVALYSAVSESVFVWGMFYCRVCARLLCFVSPCACFCHSVILCLCLCRAVSVILSLPLSLTLSLTLSLSVFSLLSLFSVSMFLCLCLSLPVSLSLMSLCLTSLSSASLSLPLPFVSPNLHMLFTPHTSLPHSTEAVKVVASATVSSSSAADSKAAAAGAGGPSKPSDPDHHDLAAAMFEENHYEILGLGEDGCDATEEQIKKACQCLQTLNERTQKAAVA